jgi:hypothetical protein
MRVSGALHAGLGVVLSVALIVMWMVASAAGAVDALEQGIERTAGFDDFAFSGPLIVGGAVALGIMFAVLGTLFSVVLAVFYNLASEWSGGLQIVVLEELQPGPATQSGAAGAGADTRGAAPLVQSRSGVPAST